MARENAGESGSECGQTLAVKLVPLAASVPTRYLRPVVSPSPPLDRFALESGLVRANTTLRAAAERLRGAERLDYTGLPAGSLALLLTESARRGAPPMLVVTPDQDTAFALAQDLAFFGVAGARGHDDLPVLRFPVPDASTFLQVASDRKATMERVAALCHLAQGLPWHFLVAPVGALLRKVAPRQALASRSRHLNVADVVDRDALSELLAGCGYLRVPVVEDAGSFAVRGAIVDVFPPLRRTAAHRARR